MSADRARPVYDVITEVLAAVRRAGLEPMRSGMHERVMEFPVQQGILRLVLYASLRGWELFFVQLGSPGAERLLAGEGFSGRRWQQAVVADIVAQALPVISARVAQAALTWFECDAPERSIVPKHREGYAYGWDVNVYTMSVSRAWSTTTAHGSGWPKQDGSDRGAGTQGARALYATRRDALLALRVEIQRWFGLALGRIDAAAGDEGGQDFRADDQSFRIG